MPASTMDPVNAALRTALTKSNMDNASLNTQLVGSTKKALLTNIEFEPATSYQSSVLDKLKSKYIVLKSPPESSNNINKKCISQESVVNGESLPKVKQELFPLQNVHLGWNNNDWNVGAGMVNMGYTCYLNSTLQALFHVPALVNWLISDKQQALACEDSGVHCVICAMRKTLLDSQQRNVGSFRPHLIYNKLRVLCRHLTPGRQEDAHEFLRYLVEAMEKSFLNRYKSHSQFDSRTKETTPLNQILGGYLRSAVRCLDCGHVSTTFQHFQDLLLDIRKAQTMEEALDGYFSREKLDDEYHCEACQKKVHATKQFSLERAPMVLCIQLKRFSVTNNKIAKNIQFKQRLDLTKFARQRPNVPYVYSLVALVTHMGPTVDCGHYTAVAQAPCGNFYEFDDSMVRPISHQAVFATNAYIMLYELERAPTTLNGNKVKPNLTSSMGTKTIYKTNSSDCLVNNDRNVTSLGSNNINDNSSSNRVYGPELPPMKIPRLVKHNGSIDGLNGVRADSTSKTIIEPECSPKETKPILSPQVKTKEEKTAKSNNSTTPPTRSEGNNNNNNKTTTTSNGSSHNNGGAIANNSNNGRGAAEKVVLHSSSNVNANPSPRKLVPYDADDNDSCSSDENEEHKHNIANNNKNNNGVPAKAANGDWKVTSSVKEERDDIKPSTNTLNKLMKMSHAGYSGHVSSWNGTKSQLTKDTENEVRQERKRALTDDHDLDKGRVKHLKMSNGISKSNPGYNPIQEFQNAKNWGGSSSSSYRQFYGNNKNRHRNRRNFHHKMNFHKGYRYKH